MSSQTASFAYDELPYENVVFFHTHPSNLAVVATLCGLTPPPVDRCRVLELGCGTGFNLVAMRRSLPDARLVGIDLSSRQIELGRALGAAVGCERIELHAGDLSAVDDTFGEFDYIIAHGVFSWVPAPVREAILAICKRRLAPSGIAYVSYNTYPGWHLHAVLRDALRFHAPPDEPPLARAGAARAAVERLAAELPEPDSDYARLLRSELEAVRGDSDTYLFHEFLEPNNQPLYFEEFARLAAAAGLRFLSEARYASSSFTQPTEVRQALCSAGGDLIRQEQLHDFRRNCAFRQSLLCHAELQPRREMSVEALGRFFLFAHNELLGEGPPGTVHVQLDSGRIVPVSDPLLRQVLYHLDRIGPRPVPVEEVTAELTRSQDQAEGEPGLAAQVAARIVDGYVAGLWALFASAPPFASAAGQQPMADPLVRHMAATESRVPSLLHTMISLTMEHRAVLGRLDGKTNLDQLTASLPLSRETIARCLNEFAAAALLVPPVAPGAADASR